MKSLPNRFPLPFLILAILALLAALWAGLMRLGWLLPALTPALALAHGPLMISGFLGTLIPLERAVAMKQKWMYAPPLLAGLGWLVASPHCPQLVRGSNSQISRWRGGASWRSRRSIRRVFPRRH